jgi:exopolysaccharide biosynthesis protein
MRITQPFLLSSAFLSFLGLTAGAAWSDAALARTYPVAQPYPEIRFERIEKAEPAQQIYVARVDLTDADVDVRVSRGGSDPDGEGEYQTTLQVPTAIAERERFDLVVNGDFFSAKQTVDAEGAQSGYVTGKWGKVSGPAVTDGYLWGPAEKERAAIAFDANKKATIGPLKDIPVGAMQVMAGSHVIVKDGLDVAPDTAGFAQTRHPRTAVGIADGGKTMVLVVVDGRRKGEATGMSLKELSALMLSLGCRDALNLDGGGSTEMALRDPVSGQLQVLNRPSDGRERAVGNVLGVSMRGVRRMPLAAPLVVPVLGDGK